MIATMVHVFVLPQHILSFVEATRENHQSSVLEPGNFRFDILQDAQDQSKFVLYEVYESEADAAAHKSTAHYIKWRDTVASWMAKPREGVKHEMLFPQSK